jgi:dTDP-4-amino-4,6-dideoxygalactose transaminase
LQLNKIRSSHIQVFESLRAQGVGVNLHYIPVHTQPYFGRLGFKPEDFPQAQAYYREAISLPMYQTLTDAQQDQVITALFQALTL